MLWLKGKDNLQEYWLFEKCYLGDCTVPLTILVVCDEKSMFIKCEDKIQKDKWKTLLTFVIQLTSAQGRKGQTMKVVKVAEALERQKSEAGMRDSRLVQRTKDQKEEEEEEEEEKDADQIEKERKVNEALAKFMSGK